MLVYSDCYPLTQYRRLDSPESPLPSFAFAIIFKRSGDCDGSAPTTTRKGQGALTMKDLGKSKCQSMFFI